MYRYISDTHLGHENVIKYDGRPFRTALEMDNKMIERWNAAVSDGDTVFILGDFSWHNPQKTAEILQKLKGQKVLIKGNHDRITPALESLFNDIRDHFEVTDGKTRVVMSHYFTPFWNGQHRDYVHIFGHIHNNLRENAMCELNLRKLREMYAIPAEAYNVGCMMPWMDYTPKTLEEIRAEYQKGRQKWMSDLNNLT